MIFDNILKMIVPSIFFPITWILPFLLQGFQLFLIRVHSWFRVAIVQQHPEGYLFNSCDFPTQSHPVARVECWLSMSQTGVQLLWCNLLCGNFPDKPAVDNRHLSPVVRVTFASLWCNQEILDQNVWCQLHLCALFFLRFLNTSCCLHRSLMSSFLNFQELRAFINLIFHLLSFLRLASLRQNRQFSSKHPDS